ncbi:MULTISPECIES: hypothetical protein [Ensifer]|uniref:Antibiotic biosynthesis monooxygenase n=1 Tax=Ensifer canadensis TaxID=555315 RepID=A0AAW4FHS3_9HYPH|nr:MULTISPECIES: hypothetical protein [Ensifer]MDP9630151.1 hypothetical protein [Ensifer adhaerens]KQW56017.1 hypothetical protein ASD02_29645 [Ensifer sp. Root1252]KRC77495.1 hypothetical protein ASE32_29410 [Ensifer sp. Root231]KRC96326.1 hypothetical protein ASE47_32340 [Ensifer sp. Root258]MBD9490099.1 hypothetical protein [Ensifer sp. ENS11]
MTTKSILELAVCIVVDKPAAAAARHRAMQAVSNYPGFISWRAVGSCEKPDMLADLVEWETLDDARSAGERVRRDPDFAPYMAAISAVMLMQHFAVEQQI